jgi:hypothetical protein
MEKQLPVYQLQIDPDINSESEVNFVGLVDLPAIEKNFVAFNEDKPLHFEIQNEERRIISGPAMLANQKIYRRDQELGEYHVVFTPETIYDIAQKFFAKSFHKNFNLMHDPSLQVSGVNVFESFIVDKERGIQPMKGFEDAQDGSWFISAKVENEEVWQLIKEGRIKGFSVEGLFQYKKPQAHSKVQAILSALEGATSEEVAEALEAFFKNFQP